MSLFGPPNIEKMKARRDVKGLIKALDYQKDANVRKAAAKALGEIRDPQAFDALITALGDSSEVSQVTASVLGQIGDVRAIEPLVIRLGESSTRTAVTDALSQFGEQAVPQLVDALDSGSELVRSHAIELLGKIGSSALTPLLVALRDGKGIVRKSIFQALGKIGDARAVTALVENLKDIYYGKDAMEALEKIGWQPGQDEDGARYWILQKNKKKCFEVGAPLVELFTKESQYYWGTEEMRIFLYPILGEIGDARAVANLVRALNHNDKPVRQAAISALGKIRDSHAVEPLVTLLQNEYEKEEYRDECSLVMDALGQLGDARAAVPLINVLRYGGNDKAAVDALVKIGELSVEPLIAALKDRVDDVRRSAAEALGKIGDVRVVEPLIARLEAKKK